MSSVEAVAAGWSARGERLGLFGAYFDAFADGKQHAAAELRAALTEDDA